MAGVEACNKNTVRERHNLNVKNVERISITLGGHIQLFLWVVMHSEIRVDLALWRTSK